MEWSDITPNIMRGSLGPGLLVKRLLPPLQGAAPDQEPTDRLRGNGSSLIGCRGSAA